MINKKTLRARTTSNDRQPGIFRRLHDLLLTRVAQQEVHESGLSVPFEPAMQDATTYVTVHEQRAVTPFRKREREVGRQEGFPVARLGTRDRDENWSGAVFMCDIEPHA